MTALPRRRLLPLALLLLTGIAPAAAQEAAPTVRRNVGGYPVSAPASQPRPLLQPAAPAPAAEAPAAAPPRPAAPAARTGQQKAPAKPPAKAAPPKSATGRPAQPATKKAPPPAAPAVSPAPGAAPPPGPGTPAAPALRRTTSERETPPPAIRTAGATAAPLVADGLRATTLPMAGEPVVTTARSDAPVEPVKKTGSSKWRVDPKFLPAVIAYDGPERPGTIVIDTEARYLYLVEPNGQARRYGIGVGRPGFEWAGRHRVTRKAEWPDWRPPPEMRARQPKLPAFMAGGPRNPLGARALYLGSTLYRIHGSNEPWSIGRAVSSGCIRMRNEDVTDLYDRVTVGTPVIVR